MRLRTKIEALERAAPPSVAPRRPGPVLSDPAQIDACERLRLYLASVPEPRPDPLPVPDYLAPDLRLVGLLPKEARLCT